MAQHSVYVSQLVPAEYALDGLLHDAAEAYVADLSYPLKSTRAMSGYKMIEQIIMYAIIQKFGLDYPKPAAIKEVDNRMLFTEKRDLLSPLDWGYELQPYPFKIDPQSPREAKASFLARFIQLTGMAIPQPA